MNPMPLLVLATLLVTAFGAETRSESRPRDARARNVAIFAYDGMEILDFSGPSEVFQASGEAFNVYTVGTTTSPVVSQRFVTITPRYSIQNAPPPDILVVPGGGADAVRKNPEVMKWIEQSAGNAEIVLTVCTGAFVLADTHLLDGQEATTWYGAVDRFRSDYPKIKVHDDARFVDNGKFVTTAGVSAGIDGALHVVSKLLGDEAAAATARYMEYDKWDPRAGLVLDSDVNRRYRAEAEARSAERARTAVPAVDEGGVQVITVAVTDDGFLPNVVTAKPGVPIRVKFERRTRAGCLAAVKIPSLNVAATPLEAGRTTVVDLGPAQPGSYTFMCGMEMFRGTLVVDR